MYYLVSASSTSVSLRTGSKVSVFISVSSILWFRLGRSLAYLSKLLLEKIFTYSLYCLGSFLATSKSVALYLAWGFSMGE